MSKKHTHSKTEEKKEYKTQEGAKYEPATPKKKADPNDVPFSDGGWTVEQLTEMNPQKREATLGATRNKEFEKNYLK